MREYLRSKGPLREREVIDMDKYDRTLGVILKTLNDYILSEENRNSLGTRGLMVVGSWARRDPVTGPTADSDLDIVVLTSTAENKFDSLEQWLEEVLGARDVSLAVKVCSDCFRQEHEIDLVTSGFLSGAFILVSPYPEVHERFRQWDELLNTPVAY